MKRLLTNKEYSRMSEEYNKVKYQCKCGHKVVIPIWWDKNLCKYCGRYVFKDKRKEFEYRVKERLK